MNVQAQKIWTMNDNLLCMRVFVSLITSCVLHDSFYSKQTKRKKLKEKVVQDQQNLC